MACVCHPAAALSLQAGLYRANFHTVWSPVSVPWKPRDGGAHVDAALIDMCSLRPRRVAGDAVDTVGPLSSEDLLQESKAR